MVKVKAVLNAVAGVVIIVCWLRLFVDFVRIDWSGRPSQAQLVAANAKWSVPPDWPALSASDISVQLIYERVEKQGRVGSSMADVDALLRAGAEARGWRQTERKISGNSIVTSYCNDRLSPVFTLTAEGDEVHVHLATYWYAQWRDPRYCGEHGPSTRGERR